MKSGIVALMISLSAASAFGQVYRCGNTFSDKPCGGNAVRVNTAGAGSGTTASQNSPGLPEYVTTCLNAVRSSASFPDKENLRVDGHAKTWENFQYAEKPMAGPVVTLQVNPMGPAGSYMGARPFVCYMSADARRVLIVSNTR